MTTNPLHWTAAFLWAVCLLLLPFKANADPDSVRTPHQGEVYLLRHALALNSFWERPETQPEIRKAFDALVTSLPKDGPPVIFVTHYINIHEFTDRATSPVFAPGEAPDQADAPWS